MNKPYDADSVPFNLYACLVVAIEHAEGREAILTNAWIENAKQAVREHEKRVGHTNETFIYPKKV